MSGNNKDTTAMILKAMDDLGPADAKTISEKADVGYTTAVRKLREWSTAGEIAKIDRGSDPAHFALLSTSEPLPALRQDLHGTDGAIDLDAEDITAPQDDTLSPADAVAPADANTDADPEVVVVPDVLPQIGGQQDDEDDPATGQEGDAAGESEIRESSEIVEEDSLAAPEQDGGSELLNDISEKEPEADVYGVTPTDPPLPDDRDDDSVAHNEGDEDTAAQGNDQPAVSPAAPTTRKYRRPKRYFHTEGLAILRANPDKAYSVGELSKLIVAKEIAAGAPATTTASTGAIGNAMFKAAAKGECLIVHPEDPVTFRAA